jgi:hypothetical protein
MPTPAPLTGVGKTISSKQGLFGRGSGDARQLYDFSGAPKRRRRFAGDRIEQRRELATVVDGVLPVAAIARMRLVWAVGVCRDVANALSASIHVKRDAEGVDTDHGSLSCL